MHLVIFTSSEGRPSYHQTDDLENAIKFVERVRNSEGVEDASVYRLTEVPLQVKTYIKVEVAANESPAPSGDGSERVDPGAARV